MLQSPDRRIQENNYIAHSWCGAAFFYTSINVYVICNNSHQEEEEPAENTSLQFVSVSDYSPSSPNSSPLLFSSRIFLLLCTIFKFSPSSSSSETFATFSPQSLYLHLDFPSIPNGYMKRSTFRTMPESDSRIMQQEE